MMVWKGCRERTFGQERFVFRKSCQHAYGTEIAPAVPQF